MGTIELKISKGAAHIYYGGARFIVIASDLYTSVSRDLVHVGFKPLILNENHIIHAPGEDTDRAGAHPVIGVGAGLRAFFFAKSYATAMEPWQEFVRACAPHQTVVFERITGFASSRVSRFRRRLAELQAAELDTLSAQVSASALELSALRVKNQELHTGLAHAQRALDTFAIEGRYIQSELAPSAETIGPNQNSAGSDKFSVQQPLHVDVSDISAVRLYIAHETTSAENEEFSDNGMLEVSLVQDVSRRVLGYINRPYSELSAGWNEFSFSDQNHAVVGDAALVVTWRGKAHHPELALADDQSDQLVLALQLVSKALQASSEQNRAKRDYGLADISTTPLGIPYLRHRLKPLSALEHSDLLSFDGENRWFQTHLNEVGPAGALLPNIPIKDLEAVEVRVASAHESAPVAAFWLLLAEGRLAQDELIGAVERREFSDRIIAQTSASLTGGEASSLSLQVPEIETIGPVSLYFCVRSLSGDSAYGWCQWSKLEFTHSIRTPDMALAGVSGGSLTKKEVRTHRFAELYSQISYIQGRVGAQKIFEKKGYSPMVVSEETGSLQTHPIADGISAAVCSGLLRPDTNMISCLIETTHPEAPDFIYIIAATSLTGRELYAALLDKRADIQSLDADSAHDSTSLTDAVLLTARRVRAGFKTTISLDLKQVSFEGHPRNLVLGVLPVESDVSFGWCRWHSISLESDPSSSASPGR